MSREAMQQALEALELAQIDVHWELNSPTRKVLRKAEKCLRAALAEQPQPLTDEEILSLVGWERAEMYMKLVPNFPVDEARQEVLKNFRAVEAEVLNRVEKLCLSIA